MGAAMRKGVAPKLRWGRFRLKVIGPLLASPAASWELQAKLRQLSERVSKPTAGAYTSTRSRGLIYVITVSQILRSFLYLSLEDHMQ